MPFHYDNCVGINQLNLFLSSPISDGFKLTMGYFCKDNLCNKDASLPKMTTNDQSQTAANKPPTKATRPKNERNTKSAAAHFTTQEALYAWLTITWSTVMAQIQFYIV